MKKNFDELVSEAEFAERLASIERGAEDVKAGRVRPLRDGIQQIADELGVTLDR